ncbi:MAG: lipid-A-disaccharide synthase [Proteobacteria bacterium]|nr:MAG: lipid-A-disaccharide synthase [Pseudomonadota bacterium]QKK12757.1 MAG: lipid-A-disaccharide synthase [Pseudomonadota bacterium]
MSTLRVGIVAGETSGDLLGAGLIRAMRLQHPSIEFEGIAGPQMISEGCRALYPAEKLSLLGLVEVLGHLPEVLRIRKRLVKHFSHAPPDVFIGIDAPDFNLNLERHLRAKGIPTVHYVSPTVWAWRTYRIHSIARAVDLMLTVFPFEAEFYREHNIPVRFVGHPLADLIPLVSDRLEARRDLGLSSRGQIVALLPGSRSSELKYLGSRFVATVDWCRQRKPNLGFIAPMASPKIRGMFEAFIAQYDEKLPITLIDGHSREVMEAADVVLAASGTATLEAMLLKRPMVVAYRMAFLTQLMMRRLLKVPNFSLPNLLAGREVVQEFFQNDVDPEKLGPAVLSFLDNPDRTHELQETFAEIHFQLRKDASKQAASAVLELVGTKGR